MRLPRARGGLHETPQEQHGADGSESVPAVVVQRWWRPHQKSEEIWATGAAVLRWLQSPSGPKDTFDPAAASAIANQLVALALLVLVRPVHRAAAELGSSVPLAIDFERSTFSVMEPPETNDGDSDECDNEDA